jgi:hypothetical protein
MSHTYKKWQKEHPNFMTPYVIQYVTKGNKVIELSEGVGFNNEAIYGITVLQKTSDGFRSILSETWNKMFKNKEEAKKHFNDVVREV